jgi:hypothetical protein
MNSLQDISKCFSYFYKDTHQKTGFYVKAQKTQYDCKRHGEQVKKLELKVRPFP